MSPPGPRLRGPAPARRAPAMRPAAAGAWSADLHQLDVEHQGGAGRDHATGTARAVTHFRRDHEAALAADLHAHDAFVPAPDHHAGANREFERLVAIDRAVELLALVLGRADVVEPVSYTHLRAHETPE